MPNNTTHNEHEKLLKIFAGIRCLNKDQLPRYLEGRLTDVEKHLVEQHMVDCDLCFDALLALQQEGLLEQYQGLSTGIQQYIRDSIRPVSQVRKMEHYVRKVKQRESMLIYFWLAAFIAGGAALLFVMNQYNYRRPHIIHAAMPVMAAANVTPAPAPAATLPTDSGLLQPHNTPPAPVARPTAAQATPVVKKDTIRAVAPPAVKRPAADSTAVVKPGAAPIKAPAKDSIKKTVVKSNTEEAAKPAPKDTPATVPAKNTEKDKKDNSSDNNTKQPAGATAASASSTKVDTDEFLYKAAMVYQRQGDLNEAINRYKRLSDGNSSRIGEMARYQMAVCYRDKGQTGKAKRVLKEVIRMDGSMKKSAQQLLDSL